MAAALWLVACGGGPVGQSPVEQGAGEGEGQVSAVAGLSLTEEGGVTRGSFQGAAGERLAFSSRLVEEGVYRIELELRGMVLAGLMDVVNGTSTLDGFTADTGRDTQLVDEDRALVSSLYDALNARLPAGQEVLPESRVLRRAVGLWAQHPTTVELQRTVLGEQGRSYTMLCSYAKCDGSYTGSCSSYNYYYYAKHDCDQGGFGYTPNWQTAQLGDHGTCSGDELYYRNGTWYCGDGGHVAYQRVRGNCFGRVGGGCGADHPYTVDATNHDGCVRNGHALASAYCDDQFLAASDDELFAPDCY